MAFLRRAPKLTLLLVGDLSILAVVTIVGFASHNELGAAGFRMLTTLIPVSIAWFFLAPAFKLYDLDQMANYRHIWRILWAMCGVAPLAALLRSIWLQSLVVPIFVLILGGVTALALLIWRSIAWWFFLRNG